MDKRITCSDCPLENIGTDELCEDYCSDMADFIDEIRADAIDECIKTITNLCGGLPNINIIGALEQLKENNNE